MFERTNFWKRLHSSLCSSYLFIQDKIGHLRFLLIHVQIQTFSNWSWFEIGQFGKAHDEYVDSIGALLKRTTIQVMLSALPFRIACSVNLFAASSASGMDRIIEIASWSEKEGISNIIIHSHIHTYVHIIEIHT